jgi:hypothetical protein
MFEHGTYLSTADVITTLSKQQSYDLRMLCSTR